MISEKTINGIKVKFNHDHYMDVRKVHELKNKIVINTEWKHYYHEGNKIIAHPLLYKVIRDKETQILYIVTKVLRQFYAGFHTVLQYDSITGSSGIVHLDNGTSIALTREPDFNQRFDLTDITITQFFEHSEEAVNAYGERVDQWFFYHMETNAKVLQHFANM